MKFELFSGRAKLPNIANNTSNAPTFIGFETKNIKKALEWIQSKNIPIAENFSTHSWGMDFYINDPDGNLVQIAQYT